MNTPLRRLTAVVFIMFLLLAGATTHIQYVQAPALAEDPRNARTTYREFGRDRGPIVVAGEAIASSVEVDTVFGRLRTFGNGPLYAPLTGYNSVVYGTSGIESAANEVLNGTAPALWRQRLATLVTGRQPLGGTVELTVDPAVQQAAWDALQGHTGAVVALDPATGAVLAMVSTPSFDPNVLAGHDTEAVRAGWTALVDDPAGPMVNRAIGGDTWAPGSTFKLVDLAAILSTGDYTPDSVVYAPTVLPLAGSTATIGNPGGAACGSGEQATLRYALEVSCNTPFANLAVELGAEAMLAQAEAFGFNDTFDIPMSVTPSRFPADLGDAELAQSAIGQRDVRATPLQMAMVAAAIANDGVLMTPYTIATERDADLTVVHEASPTVYSEPITAEVAEMMTEMMTGVVSQGTGTLAQIPGVAVAGKTGTAESGFTEGDAANPHAWFTAFAPAEDPQIALAVMIVNGGTPGVDDYTGSRLAAPIARAVIEAALR